MIRKVIMKKILKLLPILILLLCISFLAFIAFKVILGEVLLPKSQINYSIPAHKQSLEPRTELHVQVTSGSGLLLKGRELWFVTPDSIDYIAPNDTLYYFDIKKQTVSIREYDENNHIVRRQVPVDAVEGIKLHKDGIVLTSKKARIFELSGNKNHQLTLQNISDKPLTFRIQKVFR